MLKNKSGDLLGVFHRDDVGDIDLVWGDRNKNSGLDHIIEKHIERLKDFSSAEEAIQVIEDVINNGQIDEKKSKWDKVFIEKDGYAVVISKNVRNEKGEIVNENKNWVVTAFDATISPKRKEVNSSDVTRVTLNTNKGGRAVTSDERTSDSKDSELSQKSKEDAEENKKPRLEKADSKTTEVSSTDALLRDALVDVMRKIGIEVITNNKAAQSVLDRENKKTPLTGQPNRANEKPTSGSVLASIRRDSSSNPTTSKQASAKVKNDTQSAKNKIKKYFNGDFLISKTDVNKAFADFGKMFAMQDKGGSRYSILQTNSGKTIAIRISNHTAKGDNFKQDNADSNLSIVIEQYKYDNATDSNVEYTEVTIPYEAYRNKPTEVIDAIVNGVNDTLADKEFSLSSELGTVEKKGGEQANTGNKNVRFFRTANGEAYGFTVDGKVYLDPKIAGAETAIHEYTHLWATALKNANPKEWSNIVSLLKGTPLWEKVASEYPELTTDDELADEVLAHYSGKRGAERLRKEAESIANGKGSLLDKAGAISALERVKEALTRFWKATADLLHIHFTTAEEVADKVLADLLNGVNPNEVAKDKNTRFQLIGEQGAEALDKAEEATIRLDNLQVAKEMEAEKKDAKTVKLATGWERGADGKWRYEIMDGNFDPTGEMHPERRKLSQDEQKELDEAFFEIMNAFEKGALAYNENIDENTDMADIYVAGGMERKKAERMAFLEEKERNLSKQQKHIDDYLSNKQLFDAYPELKDIVVVEGDGDFVFTGKLGSYNPTTNTLTLNDISQDVLIHEVQHVIQRIEGFAKGGNPNSPELKDNREYKKWKEQLDSMRSVSERETNLYKQLQYFIGEAEKLDNVIEEMSNGLKTTDEMSAIEEKKKELFEIEKSITDISNELEEEGTKRREKVSAMLGAEKSVLQRLYNNLSGEVEARNVQKRMKMTAEERRASLAEETEDVARKDQIFILDNLGESHMGTKVDKRMESIGEHYKGKILSNEQQAVIDVFSGNKDNQPLSVTRADGKRTIIMRQGTENKAGTKHSLFRHYETNSGVITAEDIAMIPQIVQKGDLRKVKGGKGFEYIFEKDGIRYKVYTEKKQGREEFCDFYSNKKGNTVRTSTSYRDAQNGNTQSSARDDNNVANFNAKIPQSSDNPNIDGENLLRKPVGGNSGYVGYSMSKRAKQARADGRFPKTDFKREYKVSESSLQALSRIGIISDNEWHHTSSYGNKTTFYGWVNEGYAEYYLDHKKEIDKATDDLLRLKEEDIDKYFSALDDFRKEMRKSFDVGTSGLSKSKYDFEQELRSRTSDAVVAEYQRQKSEYTSTESNPKPFPSILKWQSQNEDLVKEIENKVRKEMQSSPTAIADSVRSLAEKLHLDNVEIVTDASALSGKEAKAKGFYSKSTGKITIVIPNNTSVEDAVQTLLHEAVAHYGLRKIMVVLNANKCLFIIVPLCSLLYFINSNTFLFIFLTISKQKYLNFEKI